MWKSKAFLAIIYCISLNFSETNGETLKGVTVPNPPFADLKNGKLEGFAIDLMKEIAEISGFNYTLELTPDGRYGAVVNNTINGMLGEVHNNRADFAIADITVTDVRKEYVDFTEPFIETGIVILIHRNNAYNMSSFRDLAEQTDIQYGAVQMGSTYYQISQSTDPIMAKLSRHMTNNTDNLLISLRTGVEKVNSTGFAMFVEKTFAEYITGINCDLTFIEDDNNPIPQQFAIALNKNSNYTEKFNSAIRQLKTTMKIDNLRNRYWKKCGLTTGVTTHPPSYAELLNGTIEGSAMDLM